MSKNSKTLEELTGIDLYAIACTGDKAENIITITVNHDDTAVDVKTLHIRYRSLMIARESASDFAERLRHLAENHISAHQAISKRIGRLRSWMCLLLACATVAMLAPIGVFWWPVLTLTVLGAVGIGLRRLTLDTRRNEHDMHWRNDAVLDPVLVKRYDISRGAIGRDLLAAITEPVRDELAALVAKGDASTAFAAIEELNRALLNQRQNDRLRAAQVESQRSMKAIDAVLSAAGISQRDDF